MFEKKKIKDDMVFCRISLDLKKDLDKLAEYYEMKTSTLLRELIKKAVISHNKKRGVK